MKRRRILGIPLTEWGWALAWSALILGLTSLPYLGAALYQNAEFRFGGLVYDIGDIYTYLAEMRQGAGGGWLLHLPFTSEDHPRALIHPLYLLLGKVGAAAGLPHLVTFHLARLAGGLALLLAVYVFSAHFTPHQPVRRLAFLFTGLSSGLGWLILLLAGDNWLGHPPIDFWVPEAYTLPILYAFPHISLSVALMCVALLCYLRAAGGPVEETRPALRWAIAAGFATLLLVFLVPFDIAVVWSAVGAHCLARWVRCRRFPRRAALAGLLLGLLSAPGLVYNYWVFTAIPAFREWARQNPGFSPPALHYMASLAFLGGLALAGSWRVVRRRNTDWLLLVGWAVVALGLVYLPFNLQRRLIVGLHPALCLLAVVGLIEVIAPALLRWHRLRAFLARSRRYSRAGVRRLILYGALCFTLPSNLLLLAGPILQAPARLEPMYQSGAKVAAVAWLAENSRPGEVVLCSLEEGNYLPAHSDVWVYIGHEAITSFYPRKALEVEAFFSGRLEPASALDFLRQQRIMYVYYGPRERAFGPYHISRYSFLRRVYANESVEIFRVEMRE